MIRQGKVHGICCTGANLEEDIFNLVAHDHYVRLPHYRDLTPADEQGCSIGTSIASPTPASPKHEAMRRIEAAVLDQWVQRDQAGKRLFPHEFMYEILLSGALEESTRSTRRTPG